MKRPDLCIYHGNCADGFTAAWAVWRLWGNTVEFHPGVYGEAAPGVSGRRVLIVDFSYKAPVLREMAEQAEQITVLDHHKTAAEDLQPLLAEDVIHGAFDMERSGAGLAWDHCWPKEPAPALVRYVQDRDLWRFALPNSREVSAAIFSHAYSFEAWDQLYRAMETPEGLERIIAQGEAIERKHHKDIAELLKLTRREMTIGGHRVPVANLPYTMSSDAAGALAKGQPFGACYYDREDGARIFSLRSAPDGIDVSAIAKAYGGGGHLHAAGFSAPARWEGDDALRPYPTEPNDELRDILGHMCFELASFAECFRRGGVEIKRRAEDEQAYVLDWMLRLYLRHGAGWRDAGRAELKAIEARADADKLAREPIR